MAEHDDLVRQAAEAVAADRFPVESEAGTCTCPCHRGQDRSFRISDGCRHCDLHPEHMNSANERLATEHAKRVAKLLAPFIAAAREEVAGRAGVEIVRARKEARKGALTLVIERDEADQIVAGSEEIACYGVGQTIREALLDYLSQLADYRAELDGASLGPALERERDLLEGLEPRALRSKPKEPA